MPLVLLLSFAKRSVPDPTLLNHPIAFPTAVPARTAAMPTVKLATALARARA
jgi:hypothetical protein